MDRRVSRLPSESRRIGFCMLSTTGGSSIMAGEIAWRLRQAGDTVLTCHCASDAAPSENATALSKDYAMSAAARPEMRMLARDRAASVLHRFSVSKQVDRYLGLYDQALGGST